MRFLTQSPTGWLRRAVAAVATLAAVAAVGAVAQQRHRAWQRPGGSPCHFQSLIFSWEIVPAVDLERGTSLIY